MKILIAPDSFKDGPSALEVAKYIGEGILKVYPDYQITSLPLADGGEGSIDVLKSKLGLQKVMVPTVDPLMRDMQGYYYRKDDEAYIELAVASGIALLSHEERNPMLTTTYGTGLLIKHALYQGVKSIKLFIGSSSTNDAGTGIARALGYIMINKDGEKLMGTGRDMQYIYQIHGRTVHPNLAHTSVQVICDVDNPFIGDKGAVAVYAGQKGASAEDKVFLELGMFNLAQILKSELDIDLSFMPGAGAAGGVGGGSVAFLGAEMKKGVEVIFSVLEVERHIGDADVIITGEGRLDEQTKHGKVVAGISDLCKKAKKKLIVICGKDDMSVEDKNHLGIVETIDLESIAGSKTEAMAHPAIYLKKAASSLFS